MVINMVLYTRRLDYDPISISNHVIQLDTTFMSLIEEFNKIPFKVDMKLVYAHLNPDALDMIQFVLIAKITEKPAPDAEDQRTRRRYLLISAPNFSLTSLQSFDMAKKDNKLEDYFAELTSQPIVIPESAFNDFIVHEAGLSLDKSDPAYWKNEENAATLAKHIMHVGTIEHTRN